MGQPPRGKKFPLNRLFKMLFYPICSRYATGAPLPEAAGCDSFIEDQARRRSYTNLRLKGKKGPPARGAGEPRRGETEGLFWGVKDNPSGSLARTTSPCRGGEKKRRVFLVTCKGGRELSLGTSTPCPFLIGPVSRSSRSSGRGWPRCPSLSSCTAWPRPETSRGAPFCSPRCRARRSC